MIEVEHCKGVQVCQYVTNIGVVLISDPSANATQTRCHITIAKCRFRVVVSLLECGILLH